MNSKEETIKEDSITPAATPVAVEEDINHNGFTNAPPLTQLLPPLLIVITLAAVLVQIHLVLESAIVVGVVDALLGADFGIVCWLWWVATGTIVTDSVQLKHLQAISRGYTMCQPSEQFDHSSYTFYCHACKTYTNSNCYHCKRCRRCVEFFDHHCKWLNNCIGAKNYFEFYALLITTFLLLTAGLTVSGVTLARMDHQNSEPMVLVCSILTILLATIPECWLFYLISLHTYLILAKKSTIQLILQSRSRNRIQPEDSSRKRNRVFKITFTKSNREESIAVGKINYPSREEDIDNSNSETNNNLIVHQEMKKESSDIVSIYAQNRSLPPIKNKVSFNLDKNNKSLMSCSETPAIIRRERRT